MAGFANKKETKQISDLGPIMKDVLYDSYFKFCNHFNFRDGEGIALDPYIVAKIVNRCLLGFNRIKENHDVDYPDSHKISGHLTYWICKLYPIKVLDYGLYNRKSGHYLNQIFSAMTCAILINAEKIERQKLGIKWNLNPLATSDMDRILKDYLHTLTYCDLNADLLSIIYYYLDITAKPPSS